MSNRIDDLILLAQEGLGLQRLAHVGGPCPYSAPPDGHFLVDGEGGVWLPWEDGPWYPFGNIEHAMILMCTLHINVTFKRFQYGGIETVAQDQEGYFCAQCGDTPEVIAQVITTCALQMLRGRQAVKR